MSTTEYISNTNYLHNILVSIRVLRNLIFPPVSYLHEETRWREWRWGDTVERDNEEWCIFMKELTGIGDDYPSSTLRETSNVPPHCLVPRHPPPSLPPVLYYLKHTLYEYDRHDEDSSFILLVCIKNVWNFWQPTIMKHLYFHSNIYKWKARKKRNKMFWKTHKNQLFSPPPPPPTN